MSEIFKRMNDYILYINIASYVFHYAFVFYFLYTRVERVRVFLDNVGVDVEFLAKMIVAGLTGYIIVLLFALINNRIIALIVSILVTLLSCFVMSSIMVMAIWEKQEDDTKDDKKG